MPSMTAAEVSAFLAREFPQSAPYGLTIERLEPEAARLRMPRNEQHLRPGGTISGPALCALVDIAVYALLLGRLGPVAMAVTTNLNINFLRRGPAADLLAETRLMKLGRRLAVGEVSVHADGEPAMLAHATLTYAIPSRYHNTTHPIA